MIREVDVKERLAALIDNRISLQEFEYWLDVASRSMHVDSDENAIDLVSSIHVLLSERDDHVLDEAALRAELSALRGDVVISLEVSDAPAHVRHRRSLSVSDLIAVRMPSLENLVPQMPRALANAVMPSALRLSL